VSMQRQLRAKLTESLCLRLGVSGGQQGLFPFFIAGAVWFVPGFASPGRRYPAGMI